MHQFGRIPYKMIDLGALRLLTNRSKAVVYIAICAHVNQESWTARPTLKRIAHLTGLNKSTVIRALTSLCENGLICKKTGGGRELANEYTIVTEKGGIATSPFIAESVASEEVKGCILDDKGLHSYATPTENTTEKRTEESAAHSGPTAQPVKTRKKRKPDPIWDTVVELWFSGSPLSDSQKKRVGRLVREFTQLETTPAEIRARCETARDRWQKRSMATADAVLKQWHALGEVEQAGVSRVVKAPPGKYDGM